jgi:hypothetical protein
MTKVVLPLLIFADDCLAHSGHGAALFHIHEWDWTNWAFWITTFIVAATAVWRAR